MSTDPRKYLVIVVWGNLAAVASIPCVVQSENEETACTIAKQELTRLVGEAFGGEVPVLSCEAWLLNTVLSAQVLRGDPK